MRTLLASAVLVGALSAPPAVALTTGPCDPAVQAERERVFTELAERGVRIAGVTGAGGHAEFLGRPGADPYGCDDVTLTHDRVAGVTSAGGVTIR
jgi:hypothetical protein